MHFLLAMNNKKRDNQRKGESGHLARQITLEQHTYKTNR